MNIEKNATKYFDLTELEKTNFLEAAYINEGLSFGVIATMVGTYANKIRRDTIRLGIDPRGKSDAAKLALESGRSAHPTEGIGHNEDTKIKISKSQGKVWDSLDEEAREERSKIGKASWDKKTPEEQDKFRRMGGDAIRETSRNGSRMELFIFNELVRMNYRVQLHKRSWLQNLKLETDLFIEDLLTVIEIDGPSHHLPVWGEEALEKKQNADRQKDGLVLREGLVMIRIKQRKRISQLYMREVLANLLEKLDEIKQSFPTEDKRYIEL